MAVNETLSDYVAGEIRASLARQRTSGRALAEKLGVSRSWVSYRLTGVTEITLTDLWRIAEALDVPVADLLPEPALRRERPGRFSADYADPVRPATPRIPHQVDVARSNSRPPTHRARPSWTHGAVTA